VSKPTEELRRQIVADINAGAPGAKLGSERDLAERYATSRSSLRQVLAALEEAGLVNRVIGRAGGIFISHGQIQRSLSDVVGVPAFLANQGYVAGTRVLSTKIRPPDRTAQKALRLDGSAFIIEIQRLRLADGSPISLGARAVSRRRVSWIARATARRIDLPNPRGPLRSRHLPAPTSGSRPSMRPRTRRRCSASSPSRRCC